MSELHYASATATPTGYTPAQIKKAYNIDSITGTGKDKLIAIVTSYGSPNLLKDLHIFSTQFDLPEANVLVHDCGVTGSDSGWALETTLDAEWAHAIAPDARLLVVEAASNNDMDLLQAVDYAVNSGAQIVSMSWGGNEYASQLVEDNHFDKNGVVFLAASGDDGMGAFWPASNPHVIAVGGTSLELDDNGVRTDETAWSGSGGGTSVYELKPDWQKKFGINSITKQAPDVSFDADPKTGVSVYCSVAQKGSVGWFVVGGTSLSTPAWAGILADINQYGNYITNAGKFYQLAGDTRYTNSKNCFYDITSGSNGYDAAVGYDNVTGLGSPRVNNLIWRGVTYSSHVQKIGWQSNFVDGALSGTTGMGLRVEGLKIKLSGDYPQGASITYKAHVQKLGWQTAVSNGALAGTTGKSLRVEALKITLSSLPGYEVKYRVHVQSKGWLGWQTAVNGTDVNSAPVAGTTGLSLRIEAIEVIIQKSAL